MSYSEMIVLTFFKVFFFFFGSFEFPSNFPSSTFPGGWRTIPPKDPRGNQLDPGHRKLWHHRVPPGNSGAQKDGWHNGNDQMICLEIDLPNVFLEEWKDN